MMADEIDRANDQQAFLLQAAIARTANTNHQAHAGISLHCRECGQEIPAARRQAVPGCNLCVECQGWQDKGGGFWP